MRILIVSDDAIIWNLLESQFTPAGIQVFRANDIQEAVQVATAEQPDVALLDLGVRDPIAARQLLEPMVSLDSAPAAIALTDECNPAATKKLTESGAHACFPKPLNIDALRVLIHHAAEHRLSQLHRTNGKVPSETDGRSRLVATSPAIRTIMQTIEQVAPSSVPVLMTGETGVGKTLFARLIHSMSPRKEGEYIAVNCAGIQETLLESELFGHERGAFSGAVQAKEGLFEVASGGTLFLDEIGEMSPAMQAKLLQILDDGTLRRVGATRTQTVDVRVVAATNRSLRAEVDKGAFRQDLFYRLNVVRLRIPALRDRMEDLPLLVQFYLKRYSRSERTPKTISSAALEVLQKYTWPGNVRELANVMERACLLTQSSEIDVDNLPVRLRTGGEVVQRPDAEPLSLADIQKQHIARTLVWTRGNKTKAAEILGINYKTLSNKIKQYGIEY